ncbi:hypothetical protein [Candidatus Poriferisodalis sp.]|uniref:hypothetical protein n=1 Tax=Candidatus Poriferisodalis sp. TaxID=3101277 RepID=UPI003B01FBCA
MYAKAATPPVPEQPAATPGEVAYIYSGFASGTPLTFGSMSSTGIDADSSTWGGCPSGTCGSQDCDGTVTEFYYVTDSIERKTHLVFRPGRKSSPTGSP